MSAQQKILVVPKYRIHKASKRAFIWWNQKRHYLGKAKSPESQEAYNQFVANIGPKAQEILIPFLDRPEDAPLFSTDESYSAHRKQQAVRKVNQRKTPLYPSEIKRLAKQKTEKEASRTKTYRPYNTRSYARSVRYAFEQAEKEGKTFERFTLNQLRHSRATEVRKTYGLEAAQVILGHAKADVTQIYAERNLNLAIRIAKETG